MKTGMGLMQDIDGAEVPSGGAAFWWIGQMGYIVKCGGKILYFDPYLTPKPTRTVPPLLEPAQAAHADWVFITHNHSDHLDPVAVQGIAAASARTRFVAPRTCGKRLEDLGVGTDRVVFLDAGETFAEGQLRVDAIAAQHEFFDIDPVLGHPYLGYVVECGGIRILHCGDTLKWDGMEAALARFVIDLAFVPINGRDAERLARGCKGNMTYQESVDLFGALKPRLAVPGHYEMFKDNSQDPAPFGRYMDIKFPSIPYWIGPHGEMVRLSEAIT